MIAKISFTGDIMAYLPQNKASYINGEYDYSKIFSQVQALLHKSNYVIGNLETPIAGKNLKYTQEETVFNTPIEFAQAVRKAGISIVSLANNHCLDRGLIGLRNTIENVHKCGIDTFGCYLTEESSKQPYIFEIDGFKIGLLGYTYGTNSRWQKNQLSFEDDYSVDLFRKQDDYIQHSEKSTLRSIKKFIKSFIPHFLDEKIRNIVVLDGVKTSDIRDDDRRYVDRMNKKIQRAKDNSDIVIMCMHSGGQFNDEIGEYTESLVKRIMNAGCDILVGNHSHDILGYKKYAGKLITYSLGNFCYTPKYSDYKNSVLSEYSILLHLYIDTDLKLVSKTTVSLLKTIKQSDGNSVVYPVHDLCNITKNKDRLIKESKKALLRFGILLENVDSIPEEIEF